MKLTLNFDQFVQKTIMKKMNNDENDELQIIDVKKKKKKKKKLSIKFKLRTTVAE